MTLLKANKSISWGQTTVRCIVTSELPKGKASNFLSDESLFNLAGLLQSDAMLVGMNLNIPSLAIQKIVNEQHDKKDDFQFAVRVLTHWKKMRSTANDRDKVIDLERALRCSGMNEVADMVLERYRENRVLSIEGLARFQSYSIDADMKKS